MTTQVLEAPEPTMQKHAPHDKLVIMAWSGDLDKAA